MKFSSKILKCQLSPVRKFNPCADQAVAAGRTIYHLNIGQPDVKTPESFYQRSGNSGSRRWNTHLPPACPPISTLCGAITPNWA